MWQTDTDGDNDNEKMWHRPCYRNKQQWNDAIMLQKHQACDKIEHPNGKKHAFDLNLSLFKMKKFQKLQIFGMNFENKVLADLVKSSSWNLKFKNRFVKINMSECNQIKRG